MFQNSYLFTMRVSEKERERLRGRERKERNNEREEKRSEIVREESIMIT